MAEQNTSDNQALNSSVNIELLTATLSLAANTSTQENAKRRCRIMATAWLWNSWTANPEPYFAPLGLRYLGEVLERYEEHLGAGIENFRAVALALGYAAPILSPGMFIGAQKENFLRKLAQYPGQDVYLQGAQYLLSDDMDQRAEKLKTLAAVTYHKTEEAMFVLSLFDTPAEGFAVMRPQLIRLWGKERSIALYHNMDLMRWMLFTYERGIRDCKKKDNAVLRALMKLSLQHVKEGMPGYTALKNAGYTNLDIRFANSWLVTYGNCRNAPRPSGITAEKLAVACCTEALNSVDPLPEGVYDYLEQLFEKYHSFDVNYQGYPGIWKAVEAGLHPSLPKSVAWIMQRVGQKNYYFPFDVFDAKWDVLAHDLSKTAYRTHFAYQLTSQKNLRAEDLRRWLARYKELTGLEYLSWFEEDRYADPASFALLVETGIIDLWQYFNVHVSAHPVEYELPPALYHVQKYAMSAATRAAFRFLENLMKAYSFQTLKHIFGRYFKFHEHFLSGSLYNYREDLVYLHLHRDYLSPDEGRQLYEWVDRSVFCTEPEKYSNFVKIALKDPYVQTLFEKSELSQVLKAGIETGIFNDQNYETTELKKKFFSEEEWAAEQTAKEHLRAEEERLMKEQDLAKKAEKLEKDFDGTLSSLIKFAGYYSGADRQCALRLAYDRFAAAAANTACLDTAEEWGSFFLLCGAMIQTEALPRENLVPLIKTVIQEGESNAAHG